MDQWFLVNHQYLRAGKVPRAAQIERARVRHLPASRGSKADAKESHSARLNGHFPFRCRRHPLACSCWPRLIFARDLHCPISAMRGCARCAGDADTRRFVKQEIFSMSHRGNPLIERSFEAVIAVRNIFRSPPRFRRCDPRTEGSEHIVVERVFCGHRLACSSAMRLRVASMATRPSPCFRRKSEINSAGDDPAAANPLESRPSESKKANRDFINCRVSIQ